MVKFAQVVLGPAGSGKSSYCAAMHQYCADSQRIVHIVNLDPAAEDFKYPVSVDIRELVSADDVAGELELGPNGALVYCMEFLIENLDWLEDKLEAFVDDDYLIFDLPGQIELYTHFPFMRTLVRRLESWGFRVHALYMLDSQFMADPSKFFGGCVTALSAMVQLEVSHTNVMTKMDLVHDVDAGLLEEFLGADTFSLTRRVSENTGPRFARLNDAVGQLLDDFSMVQFFPLDSADDESLATLLLQADLALQYDEEIEPRVPRDMDEPDDEQGPASDD